MVQDCDVLALVQCWKCVSCSPGTPHLVDCLVLLAAVVLPAQPLHAVTKLLELLVTKLGLIPFVAVLCTSYVHSELVPSDFYEQMLYLVNYTQ
jgi:hypothetical protein